VNYFYSQSAKISPES